jgi:hypothetical protein
MGAWGLAAAVGTVVAIVIAGGVYALAPDTFRESFFANFLSTVAGVAVAVPVTIWLTLREAGDQAKAAETAAKRTEDDRRGEVLTALRKELCEDRVTLKSRRPVVGGPREVAVPFLMDEVWSAMSDGGQLQWVRTPDLLRQVARAYVFIRTIIFLERELFDIAHYPGQRTPPPEAFGKPDYSQTPERRVLSVLDHQDVVCEAAIDEAVAAINAVIGDPVGDECPDRPAPGAPTRP